MTTPASEPRDQDQGHTSDILRGAGITMVGTLAGGAVAFVGEILIARLLGAGTYGLFSLAYVLVRIANGIALFGLGAAVLHFIAVYRNQGQTDRVVGTVFGALGLPLLLGLTAMGLLILFADVIANDVFDKPGAAVYIRVLAASVPFMALSEILALITRGFGYSRYYVLVSNVTPPTLLVTGLIVIRWLAAPVIWVAVAVIVAYATAALVGMVCVARVVGTDLWRTKPAFVFRQLYGYSIPVFVGTMLYLIMEWADILLLGRFVSDEGVGIYRACVQIVAIFDMIIFAVNAAAAHIFPVLNHHQLRDQQNHTFRLVTLLVFGLSTPVFFLIVLHARSVLLLLGDKFAAGVAVLCILAAGRLARNALGSAAFLLVLSGRQLIETRNAAAGATANILLNLALIPFFGVLGAAAGTTIAEVVLNVMRARQVRRVMGVQIPYELLVRLASVGLITAIGLAVAEHLAGVDTEAPSLALLGYAIVAAPVFAVALWFMGGSKADRALLRRALG